MFIAITRHLVLLLLCGVAWAGEITFPPSRPLELLGHPTCDLPKSSTIGLFHVPVRAAPNYAFEFRKSGRKFEIVLLLAKETGKDCGDKIVAYLIVPSHAKKEAINFDCRREDGTFNPEERVIGVITNATRPGEYAARMAWVVNLRSHSFTRLQGRRVVCIHDNYYKEEFARSKK